MKPENGTSTITTTVTTAIKMAEFRYGREEMLALFDRTILAPDPLKQIQGLHVDKTQPPLALLQMTDEETVSYLLFFYHSTSLIYIFIKFLLNKGLF